MFRRVKGFTLVELLAVLAIVALLAGLLYPVFASVKESARRTQCVSNMHQAQLATSMYMSDYDEHFMPVNHRPASPHSKFDRTWVQMILPYAPAFSIFNCPSDQNVRGLTEATFDQDLIPGDVYSKYYAASMRVNLGYNYLYLAPVVLRNGHWYAEPKTLMSITEPSRTLLFIDSIWDRTSDGRPIGGGNWLVVPPCRYTQISGPRYDTFNANGAIYTPHYGWKVGDPNSGHIYGNAWPWHVDRMNMARVDGSVKSILVPQLLAGCSVLDGWQGLIRDQSEYVWDTQ